MATETKLGLSLKDKAPNWMILCTVLAGILMAGKDDIILLIQTMPIDDEALKMKISLWVNWSLKVGTWLFGIPTLIFGMKKVNPLT